MTTKKSLGDCIPIEYDEMPSKEAFEHAVFRLRKDAKILTDVKSNKEGTNPEALLQMANFLESLAKHGHKRLKDRA